MAVSHRQAYLSYYLFSLSRGMPCLLKNTNLSNCDLHSIAISLNLVAWEGFALFALVPDTIDRSQHQQQVQSPSVTS